MTAPTLIRSAYPIAVEALLPQARDLAEQLGEVPSRNRLMKEFKVGAPKAIALRAALLALPEDHPDDDIVGRPTSGVGTLESAGPVGLAHPADPMPAHTSATAGTPPQSPPTGGPLDSIEQVKQVGHPGADTISTAVVVPEAHGRTTQRPVAWPVLLLALPAFVAIWAGWVELGKLTGFGKVNLLPGIGDGWVIDTAISLPIGVETYAAYALWVWLSGRAPVQARQFAKWSAIASLAIGALGQTTYHLMAAAGWTSAPWQITAAVACLPVAVLGMGAALAHLLHQADH